jgi:hypothetical protein
VDKTQLILALLGSAAIGALVSSVTTAVAQHFDRRARRAELLLKEALDLAQWRIDMARENRRSPEFPTNLSDKIVLAETYYGYLEHLIKHGKLPEDRRIDRTG